MTTRPLVTIVMPVFNDEDSIGAAIESCLAQSLANIEIVCVDDASSDSSVDVIEKYSAMDPRVRLVRHETNLSAFQARRTGILAARAEHLLFLDGDDALSPSAAEVAHSKAVASTADLVGFGTRILRPDGSSGGNFENRIQPRHQKLEGPRVLTGLFSVGQPASGQLWRYLFRTQLLREAYSLLPDDLVIPRANDIPLMFLAAATATRYVSVTDRLYNYRFGAGRSGQRVETLDEAKFFASAVTAIDSIGEAVAEIARHQPAPTGVLDTYASVRLSIIGNTLRYLVKNAKPELQSEVINHLAELASPADLLAAAAQFSPDSIEALKKSSPRLELGDLDVRSVLLTTMTLRTGGVSGVLLAQARMFLAAGYKVTVLARRSGSDLRGLPEGAKFIELASKDRAGRLAEWADICRSNDIDLVIDHQILYTRDWPDYALAARAAGAATVGWIHNFAGRPVYDLKDLHSLLQANLHLLAKLVVLSPLDAVFWKLRGVPHAVYLPNPPSPLLLDLARTPVTKEPPFGRVNLVWWGRLEQRTKQVLQLIEVASELKKREVQFHLKVVGPEWHDMSIDEFNSIARKLGLEDHVEAVGPRHGRELVQAIDAAHIALSTSVIEGYPLTLPEAQARGLPVLMYDLPWLAVATDNDGIISVAQGDASALADEIASLANDPERYAALSRGSLAAAQRELSYDFEVLYQQLVTDTLPAEYSPTPTLDDARRLIDLLISFAEKNTGLVQKAAASAVSPERAASSKPRSSKKPATKKTSASTSAAKSVRRPQQSAKNSPGAIAWRVAKPVGKKVLQRFPELRPLAHRAKKRIQGA